MIRWRRDPREKAYSLGAAAYRKGKSCPFPSQHSPYMSDLRIHWWIGWLDARSDDRLGKLKLICTSRSLGGGGG